MSKIPPDFVVVRKNPRFFTIFLKFSLVKTVEQFIHLSFPTITYGASKGVLEKSSSK